MNVTLDTGALIGLERGNHAVNDTLRRVHDVGGSVTVPSTVVAQAWRGPRPVLLARLLAAAEVTVAPLDAATARAVGELLAASGTSDVVDAHVVLTARLSDGAVLTSDPQDLRRLDPHLVLRAV